MDIYRVGGAVRDKLLNLKNKDNDYVVVGASIDDMLQLNYLPVGKDFPVFLHPQSKEEYALARTEKKIAKGYKGFSFYTSPNITLEQDLYRRDLSINAIAEDENGNFIDPYHGINDLNHKILRHVSDAFEEDPVRILRTARFAARFAHLGFTIAKETMQLMTNMVTNGEVDALVSERVWNEVESALLEQHPEVFFSSLRECGALKRLFPEIDRLFGVPQTERWHPEIDTGIHTMMVLQQAVRLVKQNKLNKNQSLSVVFSALVHDLGKGITPKNEWPSHKMHEYKGISLVESLCERLKVPKAIKTQALLVTQYHLLYHQFYELKNATLIKLLNSLDAFRRPERLSLYILACEADSKGRKGHEDNLMPQSQHLKELFNHVKKVAVKDIIDQGYKHQEISEQLYLNRCQASAEIRKTFTSR